MACWRLGGLAVGCPVASWSLGGALLVLLWPVSAGCWGCLVASWRLRGASLVLLWLLSGGCWRLLLAAWWLPGLLSDGCWRLLVAGWWLPGLLSRACLVAADWRLAAWTVVSRSRGCLVAAGCLCGGWLPAVLCLSGCYLAAGWAPRWWRCLAAVWRLAWRLTRNSLVAS